nr:hypothetical protein [Tanacetum cinerariifolium]
GKKISIQGSDVVGFDKSKVECFNCHKMGYFVRECRAPRSQERGRKESYRQGTKAKEKTPKALMAIDGVGWDWSYMANKGESHALVADEEAPIEFALMANTKSKELKLEKDGLDGELAGLLKASKNLDHLIESQRPSPTIASTSAEGQNKDSSTSEDVTSPNPPKPFVKFVKPKDSQPESKSKEQETPKKSQGKYAEQYRHSNKKPKAYHSTHPSKHLNSFYYDDDDDDEEDYTSAITPNEPVLSNEEPDNSLSIRDEHLDTISVTESDEVIKSSVEDLIPIPSESEDSFSIDKIDYVEASSPDSELVSSEVMEIVIPEIKASNDNPIPFYDPIISGNPLTLTPSGEKGDILLLEAFLNDDHSSDCKTKSSSTSLNSLLEETNTSDNSLLEFQTFCFDVEEI